MIVPASATPSAMPPRAAPSLNSAPPHWMSNVTSPPESSLALSAKNWIASARLPRLGPASPKNSVVCAVAAPAPRASVSATPVINAFSVMSSSQMNSA